MNDKEIIKIFTTKKGQINPNKTKISWLEKNPEIMLYLQNRYEIFINYKEALIGIFNHIENWPKCLNCNQYLNHALGKYCNSKCQLSDKNFIKIRNDKIDQISKVKKFHQTCVEHFGETAPAKNKEILQKMVDSHDYIHDNEVRKMHNLKKYGFEYIAQVPEIQQKALNTKLKNRPNDPTNHQKQEVTMLKKHNIKSALCNGQFRDKGYETYKQNPEIMQQKIKHSKQTKLEKYNDENYNNSKKHAATCLKKYDKKSYSQTEMFLKERNHKYSYDNEVFDSSWELAYYIYCKANNLNIKKCSTSFEYMYKNELHYYFPDFILDDTYLEIKGDHFFENGKMINPFDRTHDELYEAKHQCAIKNNVKILTSKDILPIIRYINTHFGKNYLKQWRK